MNEVTRFRDYLLSTVAEIVGEPSVNRLVRYLRRRLGEEKSNQLEKLVKVVVKLLDDWSGRELSEEDIELCRGVTEVLVRYLKALQRSST
ncbi:MAG: hypothetical protein DRJ40_06315 [Thermoprotei archaeon]|nr:MAG: hypothetical protein DRJ40_06315 [Thermoprotei archaeon]